MGDMHGVFNEVGTGNVPSTSAPVFDPTCGGPGQTEVWLKYGGTAGKPGGKCRKQISTCSIGRNQSTGLAPNRADTAEAEG